ncbi:hypothetical protein C2845_PM03G27080 [Panicum miliaceum]|uniref:Uncharacterized protein n=1 Tax=Panicum miliaceum TaxID=4540 RepID=A0A3L6TAG6_PANMI|nr:hypothetical protein C2845_PM03G27080 [Panicum miliaceum]
MLELEGGSEGAAVRGRQRACRCSVVVAQVLKLGGGGEDAASRAGGACTPPSPAHPLGAAAASALAAVEAGDYEAALAAAAPHLLPASASSGPPDSPAQFYADLAAAARALLRGDGDGGAVGEGFECRCAIVLSAAVAALLAFTQQNVTGPPKKFSTFPFWTSSLDEGWYSNIGGIWDAWASANLASFGSHVHGKFSLLQFIVFAELLLTSIQNLDLSDCWSVSWWLFRISMLQQNILDELSSLLFDQVQVYKNKMLVSFGELEKVSTYWDSLLFDGEGSYFASAAFLEAGIVEYKYGRVDASRLHLDSAQEACDLQLSLTGILGFRTIHQVDAKSQMVLVAKTNKSGSDEGQATEPTVALNDNAALKNARSSVTVESVEFCDILRTPRLVRSLCHILRIRWESTRSRTKQRALLMMENLVEDVGKEFPVATQRVKMVFGVHMPTLPALRKCSLGDVTNNDDHYKKALEVSNNKSARAMDKDLDKAVDAFSRAVQIDPENGEAWNNIACLHMIRGKSQAAVQAFREAVKFKRNSWEIWENYSKVALDTGNVRLCFCFALRRYCHSAAAPRSRPTPITTLEALKTVLNLSSNKRFNVDILDKVMTMLEEQPPHFVDTSEASEGANKETRQSNQLLDIIGDILQQIVRSGGSNADVWGLYARWHKTKGNLMACSEALLKQVRSLQGSGLWHDQQKFTKYAQASLQLCKVYMEISSSSGSRRELLTAEMHLKSTLKQAADFSDTEYKALDNCLEEIKNLIAATS